MNSDTSEMARAPREAAPPAPAIERPTIGRRLWYWSGSNEQAPFNVADPVQAFDAGVIFVAPTIAYPQGDGHHRVNVLVTDHFGHTAAVQNVVVLNPLSEGEESHGGRDDGYCTWMHYHVKKGTGSS